MRYVWSIILSSSLYTLSKLSKTTYPDKLFDFDCVTLQLSIKNWLLQMMAGKVLILLAILQLSTAQVNKKVFKQGRTSSIRMGNMWSLRILESLKKKKQNLKKNLYRKTGGHSHICRFDNVFLTAKKNSWWTTSYLNSTSQWTFK